MLCPTCGKDLKKGSRFCAYCGTTLGEEDLAEHLEEEVPPIGPPKPPKLPAVKYVPPPPQASLPIQTPPVPPQPPLMIAPQPSFSLPPQPAMVAPGVPKARSHKPLILLALIAIVLVLAAGGVLLAVVLTSTAKVAVPGVIGKDIAEVRQTLQQSGLNIEEAESSQSRYAEGQVLSQNPDAGMSVAKGSTVRVVVNKRTSDGGDSGHNTGDTGQGNNQDNQQQAQDISSAAAITASSTLPSDAPGVNYGPANLVDNNNATCWAEGNPGYGVNDWVKFTFQTDFQVTKLSVIPGLLKMDGNKDRWLQNGRLKTVNVIFDGGVQVSHTFQDDKTYQDITLATPVKTKTVTVVIVDAYPGQAGPTWSAVQDTSVSEMHVFGYMPGI